MAATRSKEKRLLDALGDSFEAMRQAVRTEQRRGIRFSKRLVEEIERGRKEAASLTRRLARNPADLTGLYEASTDIARRGFDHSADLASELLSGARAAGKDVSETGRSVVNANQAAARAFGEALRGGLTRVPRLPGRAKPSRRRVAKTPARKRRATARKRARTAKPPATGA
jgi:hypothetical protein